MNNTKNNINHWKQEEMRAFHGWEFSYLDNRWDMEDLPWDYISLVRKYRRNSHTLLDMGTGGGEILLSLCHPFKKSNVTEGYVPNLILCRERLQPLGITVKYIENDNCIPYQDNYFDIVINRHESFNFNEVYRVLKSNGIFITQQVGCDNSRVLSEKVTGVPLAINEEKCLQSVINKVQEDKFEVLYKNEYYAKLNFFDVGAIVFYAKNISWEFPNFSVNRHSDNLIKLQAEIDDKGKVESVEHRHVMILKKNEAF